MTEENSQENVIDVISDQITIKMQYLQNLQAAVSNHDDKLVYSLLDSRRYASEILHTENVENDVTVANLVDNLSDELSHYLSANIIKYLGHRYPFFYYEEFKQGHFRVYFGNWWDRREFGELDVLNVRFIFDETEYEKLSTSFALSKESKRYNTAKIDQISEENDHLQDLIDSQSTREAKKNEIQEELKEVNNKNGMPWESGKQKEARQELIDQLSDLEDQDDQARGAKKQIKDNEAKVLVLSKENTILSYEQKSIIDTFKNFETFEAANRSLYADYLAFLSSEKQVTDHE